MGEILKAIFLGLDSVVIFLLNTGRAQKAIELCKENLVLLNNTAATMEEQLAKYIWAVIYKTLFNAYRGICDKTNAITYGRKLLVISRECGITVQEVWLSIEMAQIYKSQNKYVQAKELYERAMTIARESGDKRGEEITNDGLGTMFESLGEYLKAKEHYEKALAIGMEIGDREGEAIVCSNLGIVFQSIGKYVKAKEYIEKALAISAEIGNKALEAASYEKLGIVFHCLEYHEKALAVTKDIGDRAGEGSCYGNLGTMFQFLGEYVKAKGYHEKALAVRKEIGDRAGEGSCYGNLGNAFHSLRKYRKSKEYQDRALAITIEVGDRSGEATCYVNLGNVFRSLGDYEQATKYYEKALVINTEIGDRRGKSVAHGSLGAVFHFLGKYVMAGEYFEKALTISKDITDGETEFGCYCYLTLLNLSQNKFQEAFSYLFLSMKKCEDLRGFNADNDHIKISLADIHDFPYQWLSGLFCDAGNPSNALYVIELGRARALADLMETRYSAEKHISTNPQSWIGIENVMKSESSCSCLYISYHAQKVFLWILETSGAIHFRHITVDKKTLYTRLAKVAENLEEFFAIMANSFRSFGILPEEDCEDRSLNDIKTKHDSCQEENLSDLRQGKDEDYPNPNLTLFYKMLIDPVSDLLREPEIIIVPDRRLYRVPFPALLYESAKYLSETFRIRIIPSLMTLKLIQDSPADYHSQTGALIVGDPAVGVVIYDGRLNKTFSPLPGARKEAEMIGRLLGVQPLLGQHATKQAVLQRIHSVSLIHLAAHGNAERGEIALAPFDSNTEIPQEDDYLLKMSDISKIQLRAKLVVLSCCHSGRGQIRAEGVVGIARAFLGSGARSVLVALWALDDSATLQLMSRFYEHLVRRESASESLHEAMKWMRENGYSEVKKWAPFMLIGDNVTFEFGK
ncbi:tetratricopeptide repeat protein 28-like [Oculina patagonica]